MAAHNSLPDISNRLNKSDEERASGSVKRYISCVAASGLKEKILKECMAMKVRSRVLNI
jgi:hypothetical protein